MKSVWILSILVLLTLSTASAQNLVTNPSFATGDFTGWTSFYIEGNAGGGGTYYLTDGLATDLPTDGHAGGHQSGTNQGNWRNGLYQEVAVTPGQMYDIACETVIASGLGASWDDDVGEAFWQDGNDLTFTTTWPGSAVTFGTPIYSDTRAWTRQFARIQPTQSSIIIGYTAFFTDPEWDYGNCEMLADNFQVKAYPPTGIEDYGWELYR